MRLTSEHFDGRHEKYIDIVDQDTGKTVGHIRSHGSGFNRYGGMDIWLFGGKYTTSLNPYEGDCQRFARGFVEGVEAVLNHMTSTTRRDGQATAA
jgi:hypothetical protein